MGDNAIHAARPGARASLAAYQAASDRGRRARLPRGAQRRRHRGRGRRQRDPRRGRRARQLPLRARAATRRRGRGRRPRAVRRLRGRGHRPRRGRASRARRPARAGVRRGGRRRGASRSTAGRMSPASRPSASRPSTTARATRCWRTPTTSGCRSSRSSAASAGSGMADGRSGRPRDRRTASGRGCWGALDAVVGEGARRSSPPRASSPRRSSLAFAAPQAANYLDGRRSPTTSLRGDLGRHWYWHRRRRRLSRAAAASARTGTSPRTRGRSCPAIPAVVRVLTDRSASRSRCAGVARVGGLRGRRGAAVLQADGAGCCPRGTALFAVVLFCVAPLSPILQVGVRRVDAAVPAVRWRCSCCSRTGGTCLLIPVVGDRGADAPERPRVRRCCCCCTSIHRFVTRRPRPVPARASASRSIVVGPVDARFARRASGRWSPGSSPASRRPTPTPSSSGASRYIGVPGAAAVHPLVPGRRVVAELARTCPTAWRLGAIAGRRSLVVAVRAFLFTAAGAAARRRSAALARRATRSTCSPCSSRSRARSGCSCRSLPALGALAMPAIARSTASALVGARHRRTDRLDVHRWWVDGYDWTPP